MVSLLARRWCWLLLMLLPALLGAVDEEDAAGKELKRKSTQARLMVVLMGIVLLGVSMIVGTMLGALYVRRIARQRRRGSTRVSEDEWYRKPLVPPPPEDDEKHD